MTSDRLAYLRWGAITLSVGTISLLTLGCFSPTEPRWPVDGTVLVGTQPLDAGTILFQPRSDDADADICRTAVINGAFSVPAEQGLVAGVYDVLVLPPQPDFEVVTQSLEQGQVPPLAGMTIPDRYTQPGTLEAQIGPDSGRGLRFELEMR